MSNLPPRESFSRKARLDVRTALARALANHLADLVFEQEAGDPFRFAAVHEDWVDYADKFVDPSAVVLPTGPVIYADAQLTPTLLEDTWEPVGRPGWGLYKEADAEVEFVVRARKTSRPARNAIVARVEEAFTPDLLTMDPVNGRMWGRYLDLPDYYCLRARYSHAQTTVLDDEQAALSGRREVEFLIRAQTMKVKVAPVQPFTVRIVSEDGIT